MVAYTGMGPRRQYTTLFLSKGHIFAFLLSLVCLVLVAAEGPNTCTYGQRRPCPTAGKLSFRGGSSPFKPRAAVGIHGASGQQTSSPSQFAPSTPLKPLDASTREAIDSFLTRDSRNSFIARVYSILSVQLLVTALSCLFFGLHPKFSNLAALAQGGNASLIAAIPLTSVLVSTFAWFRVLTSVEARRRAPQKWWWLAMFTLGEAVSVGFLSSFYKFRSVISAMGVTAVTSFSVSAYTIMQKDPNFDLTQLGASLSSWAMILLIYLCLGLLQQAGIIPAGFFPYSEMLYSIFGSCLFSAFLAYHTKLIVSGKHSKYQMNDQDYILGAMSLYSDIVNIFLNLLQLLGEEKD